MSMTKHSFSLTLALTLLFSCAFARTLPVSGTLLPLQTTPIQAGVSGTVLEVLVSSGSAVEKGQVLAHINPLFLQIDKEKSETEVHLAEITASKAKETYLRLKRLYEKEGSPISKRELDEAQCAFERAELQLKLAHLAAKQSLALLEEASIKAPYKGLIASRSVDPGCSVAAHSGDPLFKLIDTSALVFEFTLPQSEISSIKPGLKVVTQEGALLGVIDRILPEVQIESRSITCQALIEGGKLDLKPGQFLCAFIQLEEGV